MTELSNDQLIWREGEADCHVCAGVIELHQTDYRGAGAVLRCAAYGAAPGAGRPRMARGVR